jgi:hypothetical protein
MLTLLLSRSPTLFTALPLMERWWGIPRDASMMPTGNRPLTAQNSVTAVFMPAAKEALGHMGTLGVIGIGRQRDGDENADDDDDDHHNSFGGDSNWSLGL